MHSFLFLSTRINGARLSSIYYHAALGAYLRPWNSWNIQRQGVYLVGQFGNLGVLIFFSVKSLIPESGET